MFCKQSLHLLLLLLLVGSARATDLRTVARTAFDGQWVPAGFDQPTVRVGLQKVLPHGGGVRIAPRPDPGAAEYALASGRATHKDRFGAVHSLSLDVTVYETAVDARRDALDASSFSNTTDAASKPNGFPSGLAVGGLAWSFSGSATSQVVSLTILDDRVIVRVVYMPGFDRPGSLERRAMPRPPGIVEACEAVARRALARAQAARLGLAAASAPARAGALPRAAAGRTALASPAPAPAAGAGIARFERGGRRIVAPLGAYEIRVDGQRVPLRLPVMEAGGRVWIEASALP